MNKNFLVWFFIISYSALLVWLAWTGEEARRDARDIRYQTASFVQSDATLRVAISQEQVQFAAFMRGLATHGNTCAASCLSQKWAAYLNRYASFQERTALLSKAAANDWMNIAHTIDDRVAAP